MINDFIFSDIKVKTSSVIFKYRLKDRIGTVKWRTATKELFL